MKLDTDDGKRAKCIAQFGYHLQQTVTVLLGLRTAQRICES